MRAWKALAISLSLVVLIGVLGAADHIVYLHGEEIILGPEEELREHDSGCMLMVCAGDCTHFDTGWKCWTTAKYKRYDGQMNPLPILVTADADCTVIDIITRYVHCYRSQVGSGQVTTSTQCWISTIWEGSGWNDGFCSCQEL